MPRVPIANCCSVGSGKTVRYAVVKMDIRVSNLTPFFKKGDSETLYTAVMIDFRLCNGVE